MKKKNYPVKNIMFFTTKIVSLLIIILSIIFIFFSDNDENTSRLIFNALMAFVLLMLTLIPSFLEKQLQIDIPSIMEIIFLIFSILSFLLGEIGDFYIRFKWWDSMLHTMSGVLLGCVGFTFLNFFNNNNHIKSFKLGAGFAAIFVLCFTIACGTIWEIIEFLVDTVNETNMQRYRDNITGVGFVGRDALFDTMKDLLQDFGGGLFISIIGYIDIKRNNIFVNKLKVKILNEENQPTNDK
jgi:FlaA1/EpsC-like NDP-sugar epimerase